MANLSNPELEHWQTKPTQLSEPMPLSSSGQVSDLRSIPLPDYDIGIETVTTTARPNDKTAHGDYWQRTIIMSDGQKHFELLGLSNHKEADNLTVSIPAWWTSPFQGFNKETADKLMAAGHHILIKGVPVNRLAPLSRGAHDMHLSIDQLASDGLSYYFNPDEIAVHGDSNGAMQGTGIMAYASRFNRKVNNGFLVDPCLVRKVDSSDIKKLIRHPDYGIKELVCLGRQILRVTARPQERIENYIKTIEPSTSYFIGNLLLAKALFSGEFGHLLAHLPPKQRAHYLLFNHSIANQKSDFIKMVSERPDSPSITWETRSGTHMSIVNPRTANDKIRYLTNPQDSIETIDDPSAYDYSNNK